MAKRRADIELNQDNWDDDLKPISEGTFEKANKELLSQRKIITPRANRPSNTGTAGLFKSFTAFSNCSNTKAPSFNFGPTPIGVMQNGHKNEEAEYLGHLQALNQNLLDWISKHIKEDPFCILSPIFSDYDKHLSEISSKFPKQSSGDISVDEKKDSSCFPVINTTEVSKPLASSTTSSVFTFGNAVSKSSATSGTATDSAASKSLFSFGLPPITTANMQFPQSLFQFSNIPNFMRNPVEGDCKLNTSTTTIQQTDEDDNEEYIPPKPEVKEIKEDGAVFSTRCKLFYKVDTEWRERGLGNLFIKPTANDKFQLLIRADTNLGKIFVEFIWCRVSVSTLLHYSIHVISS
ncbi:unnamed protein product [Heterobilharzia americana]|nr:unnamed protein product [Heterobilharzia americana]